MLADNAKVKNAEARKREFEEREADKRRKREEKKNKKREREEEKVEEEVQRRVQSRTEGGDGYAQVGGGSGSGLKRKTEDQGDDERASEDPPRRMGVDVDQVTIDLAEEWILEIKSEVAKKLEFEEGPGGRSVEKAWDDVNEGWELPVEKVRAARAEEVAYMQGRGIWSLRPVAECWEKLGRKPVSVRWVDTDKGFMGGEVWRLGRDWSLGTLRVEIKTETTYSQGVRRWRRNGFC